jgi:hypothetical protein
MSDNLVLAVEQEVLQPKSSQLEALPLPTSDISPKEISTTQLEINGPISQRDLTAESEDINLSNTSFAIEEPKIIEATLPKAFEVKHEVHEITKETPVPMIDYPKLYSRFLSCISFSEFNESMLTETHKEMISDFIRSQESRKLVIYMDATKSPAALCISGSLPSQHFETMEYFIHEPSGMEFLTEKNFEKKVQYGKLNKNTMESLLKVMNHCNDF